MGEHRLCNFRLKHAFKPPGGEVIRGEQFAVSVPERTNICSYYLDVNLEQGRGDKTAIYYKDRTYSFRDLLRLTCKIGNVLKEIGVEPENRVLLILEDRPEWLAAWLATMRIGAVSTNAYTYLRPQDYVHFLNLVRPTVVVVDKTTRERVREAAKGLRYPKALLVVGQGVEDLQKNEFSLDQMLEHADESLEVADTHRDDVAYWNFSSGTTGNPKAVPHLHRDPYYSFESMSHYLGFTPNDIMVRVPKLFFHYSREACFFALKSGAAVVLAEERTTAAQIFDLVRKYRPSVLINVPTLMRAMIQTPEAERADLRCLRYNMASGEQLSRQLYEDFVKTFGVEVIDRLGSAESGMAYLSQRLGTVVAGSPGVVTPLVTIRLVDGDGVEVPKGKPGVLMAHCEAAGRCYVRELDKSNITFPGNQWVNTGDVFVQDENDYFWSVGRADDMVKVSGVWVAPQEVEQALHQCPSVKECAVLAVKDKDELTKVKAYIVLNEGTGRSPDEARSELKQFCREKLSPQKHPRAFEFMNELPKTGQGKIDRRLLRERGF
jgi:benzoate-CoA ligase family protein